MLNFVVFVIFVVPFVRAQVPFLEPCPNINAATNFDVERYLGKWYEAERYFALFEFGGKCVTADYEVGKNGTVSVVNEQLSAITGIKSTIEGTAKLVEGTDEAKLIVNFPSLPVNVDAPYWVIETDYENYSVVWSCNDFGILSTRNVWILTRKQNPSLDVMETAYAALDKQNISRAYLIRIDQTNCKGDN